MVVVAAGRAGDSGFDYYYYYYYYYYGETPLAGVETTCNGAAFGEVGCSGTAGTVPGECGGRASSPQTSPPKQVAKDQSARVCKHRSRNREL